MKNFVRILSVILALGAVGLLAGCTSYRSARSTPRTVNASDFEVVETSTKRLLTTQEMLQLKIAVSKYLDQEGAVASGDYYVKVFLGPDQDGVPADWVVVRFTRDSATRFSLLASYPAYSPGYQSYAAYDYYPYGYDHFSRISFQYYNDPYYGNGYYFPPRRHNHDRDRDRDRDRDKDRDGDTPRTGDRPRFKPIDPVGSPPQVTENRGDGNRGGRNRGEGDSPGRNRPPRGDNPAQRDATSERPPAPARPSGGGFATRSEMHRRHDNPAPNSSAQPIRTSSQDAPRSEPVRQESTRSEPSFRTSSQSAPSYSAPARSESSSSSSSNSNSSQRETNESASQRQRLE